jgi:hypothetical protein
MLQKWERTGRLILLFILCADGGMFAQAQTQAETVNEWYQERYLDDDNWLYFRDIALERGMYMATGPSDDLSDGRITSLYGSFFLNNILGFRSGASLITDFEDTFLKIPCLFALRSPTFSGPNLESQNFGEFFRNLILYIIPKRCEINLGPALGYVWNNPRRWAFSIDGNFRLGLQFWRIGINGNIGVNYLLTKNFVDRDFLSAKTVRPAWFVNLSGGVSFRF